MGSTFVSLLRISILYLRVSRSIIYSTCSSPAKSLSHIPSLKSTEPRDCSQDSVLCVWKIRGRLKKLGEQDTEVKTGFRSGSRTTYYPVSSHTVRTECWLWVEAVTGKGCTAGTLCSALHPHRPCHIGPIQKQIASWQMIDEQRAQNTVSVPQDRNLTGDRRPGHNNRASNPVRRAFANVNLKQITRWLSERVIFRGPKPG